MIGGEEEELNARRQVLAEWQANYTEAAETYGVPLSSEKRVVGGERSETLGGEVMGMHGGARPMLSKLCRCAG